MVNRLRRRTSDQTVLGSVSVSVSFYSDDGFQPMQKELYNNNDKKTE